MPTPRFPIVRLAITAGALLPAAAAVAVAQGRTAAPLLTVPASARAAAMGDAYGPARAASVDPAAMFYNPAQLAGSTTTAASLSVERYLASSTLFALAAARRAGPVTVGVGALALDYPEAAEIVPEGDGTTGSETGARISASELVPTLAVAAGGARARVGVATKYVSQALPGARGGAVAVDVGAAAEAARGGWGRLEVSGAIQHVGGEISTGGASAPLPRTWRAGAALEDHALARARWSVLAELVGARDTPVSVRTGVEGTWALAGIALAARAGWATQPAGALAEPLTLGGGLRRDHLWLDYALRRFGALGSTHRVGVRWQR